LNPLAPVLLPALDVGRLLLQVARGVAGATILGARDGDAGTQVGGPDAVGVQARERVVADGVAVPGQEVNVPGRSIPVGTPAVDRTIHVPPVGTPPITYRTPQVSIGLDTPPVGTPEVVVATPPVGIATPAVVVPGQRITTPPVGLAPQRVDLDASGLAVQTQELRGTVFLGPASVPYSVPAQRVGASDLPPGVPTSLRGETPALEVLPAQTHTTEPIPVLGAQRVDVPGQEVARVPRTTLLEPQHLGEVVVPGQRVDVPGVRLLDGRTERIQVPAQHVGVVETPAVQQRTDPVVVTEERIAFPGASHIVHPPGGDMDVGYVGYGLQDDSSLYPFACTALVGCVEGRTWLKPFVEYADARLDAAAATLDRGVVVAV
jgi:hypothetical protein